jgi:hypothetical protein
VAAGYTQVPHESSRGCEFKVLRAVAAARAVAGGGAAESDASVAGGARCRAGGGSETGVGGVIGGEMGGAEGLSGAVARRVEAICAGGRPAWRDKRGFEKGKVGAVGSGRKEVSDRSNGRGKGGGRGSWAAAALGSCGADVRAAAARPGAGTAWEARKSVRGAAEAVRCISTVAVDVVGG